VSSLSVASKRRTRVSDDSPKRSPWRLGSVKWRKSTFSTAGECVVVAGVGEGMALRNSNAPDAGTLFLTRAGLAGWIAGCKRGEFDDLSG
jgi:hypothetical protein